MKKLLCAMIAVVYLTGSVWATEGTIPAKTLISEAKQNQIRFDKNHKGQTVTTEGFVDTIEEKDGKYVMKIFGELRPTGPLNYIECIFQKSQENALLEPNAGDSVVLKGIYNGKQQSQVGALILSDCEILEIITTPQRTDIEEAAGILANLRNLKAASLMFAADNYDDVHAGRLDSAITASNSVQKLLEKYLDNPVGPSYLFTIATINGEKKWFVGHKFTEEPEGVKKALMIRGAGLLNENMTPYDGGNLVFMIAR